MSIYTQLDLLHEGALEKIKGIINATDTLALQEESSFDAHRQDLSGQAYGAISDYRKLLAVAGTALSFSAGGAFSEDDSAKIASDALQSKVTYQIYVDKLKDLKLRLRQAQIISADAASGIIHRQRIQEYCKDEAEDDNADPTKSLEETKAELFSGRQPKGGAATKLAKLSTQTQVLEKNKAITASLQTTRQMMATSIMHTELNIDTVDQQTRDLGNLNDKFSDFNDILVRSRAIVKFIQKQDRSDKNRIYMSLGFLALTCAWIIWRRILKIPVYFMLWSFFKIFRIFAWFTGQTSKVLTPAVSVAVSEASKLPQGTLVSESSVADTASAVVTAVTSAAIAASIIASSSASQSSSEAYVSSSIVLDEEFVMEIDDDSTASSWDDIVSAAEDLDESIESATTASSASDNGIQDEL